MTEAYQFPRLKIKLILITKIGSVTEAISGPTVADLADSAHQIGHVTEAISGHTLAFPADSAHKIGVTVATPDLTLADRSS